ncbi:Faf1p [Sporobolomyces koalae]|uniref:Faf1p n=1 Tax=Sporobolomyces koalae TaxID=500713 RepID=UPI003172E4E1
MAGSKKRSSSTVTASATSSNPVKRRAIELVSSSNSSKQRAVPTKTAAAPKKSNRPGFDLSDSSESSSESEPEPGGLDKVQDEEEDQQSLLEAALARHQLEFLQSALPNSSIVLPGSRPAAPQPHKEKKSVWDLDLEDLEDQEDDDDDSDSDSDDHDNSKEQQAVPQRVAQVVAFSEPGRSPSLITSGGSSLPMSKREMRDFKAGKVKSNVLAKPSVADEANQKYRGSKGGKKPATNVASSRPGQPDAAPEEDETHLLKLDQHLSTLTRTLNNPNSNTASALPDLLRELPIAQTKPLKGHTPLPKNAPRSLRAGQNAANLKRAQLRDAASGLAPGSTRTAGGTGLGLSREAKTLKEKRKEEGLDHRERGLGARVGRFGRGMISLSKGEISRVQGMGSSSSSFSRGGGGGGKKRK